MLTFMTEGQEESRKTAQILSIKMVLSINAVHAPERRQRHRS